MNWQETIEEVINENPELPKDINIDNGKNAVRYGYQYRKVAQRLCDRTEGKLNFCLPDVEVILHWLAEIILSGVAYDIIKKVWNTLVQKLKNHDNLSEEAKAVFSTEEKLHEFYEYIREFDDGLVHIKETERLYIEEEICADLSAEMRGEIFSKYQRFPTTEEYMEIFKKVKMQMDEMLKRK